MQDTTLRGSPRAFVIRPGTVDDIPAVSEIDTQETGLAKPDYWRDLFSPDGGGAESRAVMVAERDGAVVGFIIGEVRAWEFGSQPCGWVFAISVRPDAREDGVASALFEALSDFFKQTGVKKVRTMIRRDAHLLMSFFRSQGMMAGPFLQLEKDLSE